MGGIAATTVLTTITSYDPVLFILSGAAGAFIPDICHGGSKIGRKFPFLSKVINIIFGHRTFTHSLLFLLLVTLLIQLMIDHSSIIAGVFIGMASHLLLDAATKQGIQLLYPVALRIRLPLTTKTGGSVEKVILFLLTVVSIYYGSEIVKPYFN